MKKQKTLHRFAAVAAVLLALCLVFVMPVGATEETTWVEVSTFDALNSAFTNGGHVKLADSFSVSGSSVTVSNGKPVVLDLAGKTITVTESSTPSYGFINLDPGSEFTLMDSVGEGKITLTATQNRKWDAYSSVISVQRATATIEGGTIQHLGGTDMAYGIDVLTNGKDTKAKLVVKGGSIVSNYRAIRLFLNGAGDACCSLEVNGGSISGENVGIWLQDPNTNNNGCDAKITSGSVSGGTGGAIYVFTTAGSTESSAQSLKITGGTLTSPSSSGTIQTGNILPDYNIEISPSAEILNTGNGPAIADRGGLLVPVKATITGDDEVSSSDKFVGTYTASPIGKSYEWMVDEKVVATTDANTLSYTFEPVGIAMSKEKKVSVKVILSDEYSVITEPITVTVPVKYEVSFDANGGSGSMSNDYTYSDAADLALPNNGFTAPSGKIFKAWNVSNTEYAEGDSVTINADTVIYAVWDDIALTAAPTKVGFDSVKVGYTQPEAKEVVITNLGNVPVTLNAATTSTNYVVTVAPTTEIASKTGTATVSIQPKEGLAVGNYADTLTIQVEGSDEVMTIPISFLVYQPTSGGSSKPVEEPEEPVEPEVPVEPETPTEEPEAGEATVETEVTDGGEVELETPAAGGSAAADEDEAKITGVVLPTGTDSEVTFVPVSEQAAPAGKETQTKKVFEINVPTYEKGKAAVIKFTMTVAELAADGKEAADVALWHFDEETGEWTKLVTSYTIVDGVVYFEAITNDFSPFAIVYEDEPVDEPVDEPETPASPAPVLAVLAGLGAAVVLRRK